MGRRNKEYSKDLNHQAYDRLIQMLRAGEGTNKKEAIANGTDREKIFSYETYRSYYKHVKYFVRYVNERHPECTTLKKARRYVNEWLQYRVDHGGQDGKPLSAWTITLERQALGKLYGITPDDPNYFVAPQRHRADIVRSRRDAVRDAGFSEANNDELIKFCLGTGCRRNVLERLRGSDLATRDEIRDEIGALEGRNALSDTEYRHLETLRDAMEQFPDREYFVHHRRDKGGREHYAPIIGEHTEQIVARFRATGPDQKVWQHVSTMADIHSYRADYATALYKELARPLEQIPYDRVNKGSGCRYQSEVYCCKKDEKGKRMDKRAMLKVSKALGHSRLEGVATILLTN